VKYVAKIYERPGGIAGLFAPTPVDRIIGANEGKRSTKTYISSEKAALYLALIKRHAEGILRTVQEMHERDYGVLLPPERILALYPGAQAWHIVHAQLVEHYASNKGFSLRVVSGMIHDALQQAKGAESSVQANGAMGDKKEVAVAAG
jgi:hypothetical protein